jgi:ribosomal protein S18 acetylase RimI-like enzyme
MDEKNKMDSIEVLEVTSWSEEVLQAINKLLTQLTSTHLNFSENVYKDMLSSDNSTLIIARDKSHGGEIIGTLSYATFLVPTGLNFRIEDVVVDQKARGRGIGRKLMEYAIEKGQKMKADKIDLTSTETRIAANQLYISLGFKIKDTNVYRYE